MQPSIQILARSIKNVTHSPPSFSTEHVLKSWRINVEVSATQCRTDVILVWHDSSGLVYGKY